MPDPDDELEALYRSEIAAETRRARMHAAEVRRSRGVAWSGCGPEPFAPRAPEAIRERAIRVLEQRKVWRASAPGRFLGAIVEGQQAAALAHQACERARAACSRGFAEEFGACATALKELEHEALRLSRTVALAKRALTLR